MLDLKVVNNIIEGIEIERESLVLLQFWGDDRDREILHSFSYAIAKSGSTPLEVQHSREYYKELYRNINEDIFTDKYFSIFQKVDVVIDICMYTPVKPHDEFLEEKFDLYRSYMRNLFRELGSKKKFLQIRIPTQENAQESNMDFNEYVSAMTSAYDINYMDLKREAENILSNIKDKNSVIINTN